MAPGPNPFWLVLLGLFFVVLGVVLIRFRWFLDRYLRDWTRMWGGNPEPWEGVHAFGLAMMGVVLVGIGLFVVGGSFYWAMHPDKWPGRTG